MNGKRERILALDMLRGLFLVVIIVDHLSLFPNVLEIFSGRGHLWSSAAEGFFIISGTLVGYIYGPQMAKSVWSTTAKIWKRAAELYLYSIASTFIFVYWGNHALQGAKPGLWIQPPVLELITKVLTLRYVYGWTDFLTHYVVYMVTAPLAVYLISRRKWWLVAAASLAIWSHRGLSMDKAWQVLFMAGVLFGYYLPLFEHKAKILTQLGKRWSMWLLYGTGAVLYIASLVAIRVPEYFDDRHLSEGRLYDMTRALTRFHDHTLALFDKNTLGPGRMLISFVWFAALYVLFRKNEQRIMRLSRGVLHAFGRVSLFVYVAHAVVLFALHQVLPSTTGFIANTIITVWVIAVIYEFVKYRDTIVRYDLSSMLPLRLKMSQSSSFVYLSSSSD